MTQNYNPRKETAETLSWTLTKVEEVPYRVTMRWAFYRCVQELGLTKEDYQRFKKWTSKARKNFWNGWRPWTLIDDTRGLIELGDGFGNFKEWVKEVKDMKPTYEKFSSQEKLLMIWFEAEAMRSQFMHYAAPYHVPMAPFRGDPGPDYKWRIAKFLDELDENYGPKPIVILYFGDYEPIGKTGSRGKGIRIPIDALKDIRPWFWSLQINRGISKDDLTDLKFIRCGLNSEHIEQWDLPTNPERPGEYQWESLSDELAGELITGSIKEHWNLESIKKIERREEKDKKKWTPFVEEIIKKI